MQSRQWTLFGGCGGRGCGVSKNITNKYFTVERVSGVSSSDWIESWREVERRRHKDMPKRPIIALGGSGCLNAVCVLIMRKGFPIVLVG